MPLGSHSYPMVSVIIPAYNVEGYIARAIESVQRQTFTDYELLVVNDGSTDRTGKIIQQYTRHDLRIVDFHIENSGAPAARNLALDHARGKYIHFMDADDWAEPAMLADMVALAEKDHLELVVAGFYIDTYYGNAGEYTTELKSRPSMVYPTQHEFRVAAAQLFDENLLYPPWNKLFLRDRIERLNIRFRPTFWDDFSIADRFGKDAIIDTYHRAFQDWHRSVVYITELALVLNWKSWEYAESNPDLSRLYEYLWDIVNTWCYDNLKGRDLDYYYKTTD